ncbi:hypothetical protein Syun_021015 [Stephania yunnanensis]|uniref:Uncharacterized protein n=1 Tax=Stephania yunnanensis TaxID=152371 RepID=A0AAP0NPE4_9MAGN
MEFFFRDASEELPRAELNFDNQDIQRCPFFRNINIPTNFSLLSPVNFPMPNFGILGLSDTLIHVRDQFTDFMFFEVKPRRFRKLMSLKFGAKKQPKVNQHQSAATEPKIMWRHTTPIMIADFESKEPRLDLSNLSASYVTRHDTEKLLDRLLRIPRHRHWNGDGTVESFVGQWGLELPFMDIILELYCKGRKATKQPRYTKPPKSYSP